jgi:DNA-binding response OmpR family regulator
MNPPQRVILVEDYDELRETTADYLRIAGFDVTAVGSGLEFYEKIARQEYAVALIDLGLPDQSGEVLVDYVRRNTASAIIVVSGRKSSEARIKCYEIGADLFLGKPVDYCELFAAVKSLVNRTKVATAGPARLAGPAGPADAAIWQLLEKPRELVAPDGVAIILTASEYNLLRWLAEGVLAASRDKLLAKLHESGNSSTIRALESLVRRTRKKIMDRTGHHAPILTHYGTGYAFAAKLVVVK